MIYKVSYVVIGGHHPGVIVNQDRAPRVGEVVSFGGYQFRIQEVKDLMPPRGDFAYLHVTVRPLEAVERAGS
ncbi:MAG: hypothetical protein PVI59_02355 [Anaerolineae bacterium]|jgi:hypothetical protein